MKEGEIRKKNGSAVEKGTQRSTIGKDRRRRGCDGAEMKRNNTKEKNLKLLSFNAIAELTECGVKKKGYREM